MAGKKSEIKYVPTPVYLCPRARGRAAMPMESALEAERSVGDEQRHRGRSASGIVFTQHIEVHSKAVRL